MSSFLNMDTFMVLLIFVFCGIVIVAGVIRSSRRYSKELDERWKHTREQKNAHLEMWSNDHER